jgi:hypothetical protein
MNPAITNPAPSTPKRKRGLPPTVAEKLSSSRLNTSVATSVDSFAEDEDTEHCKSPRTSVARDFQRLDIKGGAIKQLNLKGSNYTYDGHLQPTNNGKRLKSSRPKFEKEIQETPEVARKTFSPDPACDLAASDFANTFQDFAKSFEVDNGLKTTVTPKVARKTFSPDPAGELAALDFANTFQNFAKSFQVNDGLKPVIFRGLDAHSMSSAGKLQRSYPSINRLSESKSRAPKPAPLPPVEASVEAESSDSDDVIVDPERAALAWHDDEITGHDPSDPEDDGEGINGIGFKPTPAEARARAQRRRQQLAEYRSREMREARAKRSERRRGGASAGTDKHEDSKADTPRRVRFCDPDQNRRVTTV